jgi:hypothetical protein
MFQHIARFAYGRGGSTHHRYSYGRHSPGLKFKAALPKELTSPLNLLALGRRQPLYVAFRLSRDLCFC